MQVPHAVRVYVDWPATGMGGEEFDYTILQHACMHNYSRASGEQTKNFHVSVHTCMHTHTHAYKYYTHIDLALATSK